MSARRPVVFRFALIALIAVGAVMGLTWSAAAHPPAQHMPQRADTSTLMPVAPGLGFPSAAGPTSAECANGMAGPYPCENVDLESFVPLGLLGGATGNDIWGWTDPQNGDEYAIVATSISTGFVNVTDPQNPVVVGILPTEEVGAFVLWRDVKVHKNHAFIVSEIDGHGMQVFDLTRLRGRTSPTVFDADTAYQEFGNAHNIAINNQSQTAYVVGSDMCVNDGENGGLAMIDISDPTQPGPLKCAPVDLPAAGDPDDGSNNYVHDVQCVNYRASDPDPDYAGKEICFGSNENAVVIYDVSNKESPKVLSQTTYPTAAYTHQGWLTPDRKHFVFGDELDEGIASDPTLEPTVDSTTTYVTDVTDLDAPTAPRADSQETGSIDHNLFIKGSRVYQSNYTAGLRIQEFNAAAAASDDLLTEIGFFDVVPGVDVNDFAGTWSNYPYFESGTVVVSTIENEASGLFVLRPRLDGEPGRGAGGGQQGGGQGGSGGQSDDARSSRGCFTPATQARKKRIGRAGLGNRRSNVRRTFGAEGRYRRFLDRYCLSDDSTIRVGYPSSKQMRRLVARERRRLRGKASLVLTSSRRSKLRGVNVGDGVRELRDRTGDRRGVRIGKNVWFVRRGQRAGHVFKVQNGIVREVGLADRRQTATNARVKRFFTSER
jgi:choice-of-anchor B domain-containing protein